MSIVRPIEEAVANHLVGSFVVCEGTIGNVLYSNPYVDSTSSYRNWRLLIQDVKIGTVQVDHVILHGCRALISLKAGHYYGKKISFTAKVKPYLYQNQARWGLTFPYKNIEIFD